ncbi:hypothetical protein HQ535_11925 [bacterium]|nr:hypothetical protein [bacterium]
MRRIILAVLVGAVVVLAALAPKPDDVGEPLAGGDVVRPGIGSPTDAAIWYCPWAQSNATRDSFLAVASIDPALAAFTFPVSIPGEDADRAALDVVGPGASGIDLSDIARRGDSPFFVEFDDGPAAVSVTVSGQAVLSADACVVSGPEVWHFSGGSTMAGETLKLRVFNPFPETAKVTVTAVSEIGVEALADLRTVSVSPRSWRDFDFETLLRQRQTLIVSVSAEEGLVVPAMSFTSGEAGDGDWWSGVGLSSEWDVPIASAEDLDGDLVVFNPGLAPVEVRVILFTAEAAVIDAGSLTVDANTPARFTLPSGLGPAAARIESTGPITAGVVARGGAGTAIASAIPEPSREWLVPGLRSVGLERGTLWILNAGEESVSVSVTAFTGGELIAEKIVIDGSSLVRIPVLGNDAIGYLVESSDVISVGWSISGPTGSAISAASPFSDG